MSGNPEQIALRELFGVSKRGDNIIPFGPGDRSECEALVSADPSLRLVHYFTSDWREMHETG